MSVERDAFQLNEAAKAAASATDIESQAKSSAAVVVAKYADLQKLLAAWTEGLAAGTYTQSEVDQLTAMSTSLAPLASAATTYLASFGA